MSNLKKRDEGESVILQLGCSVHLVGHMFMCPTQEHLCMIDELFIFKVIM